VGSCVLTTTEGKDKEALQETFFLDKMEVRYSDVLTSTNTVSRTSHFGRPEFSRRKLIVW